MTRAVLAICFLGALLAGCATTRPCEPDETINLLTAFENACPVEQQRLDH